MNMPDPYERHSAPSAWSYGASQPSRSQARAAAAKDDPVLPVRKMKHGEEKCAGSPDKMHHGEIVSPVPHYAGPKGSIRKAVCEWHPWWGRQRNRTGDDAMVWWSCSHQEICTYCSKIMRRVNELGSRCPAYPGDAEQKQQAIARFIEQENRPRWSWRRKPVINGPQGYRKPKGTGK